MNRNSSPVSPARVEGTIVNRGALRHRARSAVAVAFLLLGAATLQAGRAETWLKVSTPELTVVTTLPVKEATARAAEFTQFIAALRSYFGNSKVKLPALTIVIFARERDFERYYPLLGPGGKPQPVEGFFSRHQSWAVAGLTARISDETRRTIFHEGVHWFLSTTETLNPVWFEEGMAEVFSTFRVEKNQAEWGRAIDDHVMLLRAAAALPLEKLLYTARGDLFGNDSIRTGMVYAESWAFVHFLLFGKHAVPGGSFANYSEALASGANPDQAFLQAFGRTYAEMDKMLSKYLIGGSYYVARRPLVPVAPPAVSAATPAELEDALGRLAFAGGRMPLALSHARAAVAAAPLDPRGHELLGLALQAEGNQPGAHAAFQAAIERGSKDFQPYFELALASSLTAARNDGVLSPAAARVIATQYEHAINFYPRYAASYENLGGVLCLAEPWSHEDQKFLDFGLKIFPDNATIELGLAQLLHRSGDLTGARRHLDHVLESRSSLSMEVSRYAHMLDAAWEQAEITRQIEELRAAKRFGDAITLVDKTVAAGVQHPVRQQLASIRAQLVIADLSLQLNALLEARDWTAARRILNELLASGAPPSFKAQARRTLADLSGRETKAQPTSSK